MGGHVVVRGAPAASVGDVARVVLVAARRRRRPPSLVPSLDEVPILAVAAAAATGTTTFLDVDELRVKETDRLGRDAPARRRARRDRAALAGDALVVDGLGTARALPALRVRRDGRPPHGDGRGGRRDRRAPAASSRASPASRPATPGSSRT